MTNLSSLLLSLLAVHTVNANVLVDWRDCNDNVIRKSYAIGDWSHDVPSCQRAIRIPQPGYDECTIYADITMGGLTLKNSADFTDLRKLPYFYAIYCTLQA